MSMCRAILADDHGVLRAGLRSLLDEQPDIDVVGEAASADDAVQLARELQPDVAIVDVRMPGDGLVAAQRIRQESPEVAVIILSQYDDPAYVRRALVAGVSGYALKQSSGDELLEAIRIVSSGNMYLHPAVAKAVVEQRYGPQQAEEGNGPPLCDRERQVLRLVALGYTLEQIAGEMNLCARTVEIYKMRAMERLNLSGRTAVVRYALDHGLLEGDSHDGR